MRKIENIDEQIKFCTDKVAQLKIKLGKTSSAKILPDVTPAPVIEISADVQKWKDKYDSCYAELINIKQAQLHRQLSYDQMQLFKPAGIPLPESESDTESEEEEDNLINLVLGSDIEDSDDEEDEEEEDEEDYEDF